MNTADSPSQGQGQGTAPDQELSIPKHRFDEIARQLQEAKEREAIKDRLYTEQMQQFRQASRPQEPEFQLTPEETGLDPQTHKAILLAADKISEHKLRKERVQFNQIIGNMGNELEATKFLAKHGADKAKYLDQIQSEQKKYAQNTGGQYMDPEIAYKLVRFDEMEALEKRRQGQAQAVTDQGAQAPAQAAQPQQVTRPAPSAPAAARTQTQATPAGASTLADDDLDAIEARLNEQFAAGNTY